MPISTSKTQAVFKKAMQVMPYGVSSNFRYLGDDTPVISRGEGGHVWDMDGNRFIDYRLAFGPIILGHADPRVNARITQAMNNGVLFAHTHPLEIEVAERMIRMCPGVEKVRFANSGTEATLHALRIARAYTGRDKIIKFEGCYHGFHDYVLFSTNMSPRGALGSRRSPLPAYNTSGVPEVVRGLGIAVPYNDPETLERVLKQRWQEVAAILVEPIAGNMGSIMPEPGFLQAVRRLCDEYGIVMIMDEVKTGFRLARGGATEYFGVKGDLMTYAKSLANGYPLAAIGGSNTVMGVIEPGYMAHGGTYCGNGVGTAAAAATLEILETTDALEQINRRGARLMQGIDDVLTEAGLEHSLHGVPGMFSFFLNPQEPVKDFRAVTRTDLDLTERLAGEMRSRGVEYESDSREPWFLCAAHTDQDVDETLNALNDAVKVIKH